MTDIAEPTRRRRGFSAVEFVVILVMFGIGVVTLYSMFWSTSEEAFKSKWAYLSAHAAREELEAIRTLNLFGKGGAAAYTGHDWRPLGGSMLTDLESGAAEGNEDYQYPDDYARIETKVEIQEVPRARQVTVFVRYQAKGSSEYGLQTKSGKSMPIGTYRTVITDRENR